MSMLSRRSWLRSSVFEPLEPFAAASGALAMNAVPSAPRQRISDRHFPNVPLRTHVGRRVRFYDDLIRDRIVLINVMYADCGGVCPTITSNLVKVQQLLGARAGRDVFIYSLTLDPLHDTPRVLQTYAQHHGVGRGWTFLTGRPDDLELLRRRLGFVDPDPELDRDRSSHIGNIRFGNERLMLWGACPGLSEPQRIVDAITAVTRSA